MDRKTSYLKMKTDSDLGAASELLGSDLKDVGTAMKNFANHAIKLGSLGFGTSFLKWVACFAAIYLLILDRTNWKTNILTSLLVPYIYLSLPSWLFSILSGEIGKWIAFIAVVLRLFFPKHFPDWLEMPGSLILLLVVAPSFLSGTVRGGIIGLAICLVIGCYLLQEHIRASGGFRNSFTKSNGISNSIGILLLFVYPVWAIVLYIL
ncbi:cold-regulated 413 plasma membrane protein 2-like [Salvia miltiorrhiza]|uniref:cold-regulated 413 plasma membrane protein 2-like n=1 Tax=Salvia miltiorrhiza TaxID=226208 RepID=UPI0025ABC90D|nr:cold-regulated 413 plasma membrane protein 2-like [Salvia miltiorrhiza]